MLRAIRFAAKLGFRIDPACETPLWEMAPLLDGVPAARLFDEVLKLFMGRTGVQAFEKLRPRWFRFASYPLGVLHSGQQNIAKTRQARIVSDTPENDEDQQ